MDEDLRRSFCPRLSEGETLYDALGQAAIARVSENNKIEISGYTFPDLQSAASYALNDEVLVSEGLALRYWHFRSPVGELLPLLHRAGLSHQKTPLANTQLTPLSPRIIQSESDGRIIMVRCPGLRARDIQGRYIAQDLQADVEKIREWSPALVISILESHEFIHLGLPSYVEDTFRSSSMQQLLLPIPKNKPIEYSLSKLWHVINERVLTQLGSGQDVLVHSGADMGRAGYIAAKILVGQGVEPADAIARVRAIHPYAIESFAQEMELLLTSRK